MPKAVGGMTAETMRNLATCLDTLTELTDSTGWTFHNMTAMDASEEVTVRIVWSEPDERYIAATE